MKIQDESIYAALYIRVSTEEQIEYSPDSQKKLLTDYAKSHGMNIKEEHIFIDEGISGRKADKRPAFQNMIAMARSKEKPFQRILVWKFSRFARNQEESIVYKNMLRKDGVEVISISEPIIDGPFGSLIERIIEWMDEYYSTRLSGEVLRGMSQKAATNGILPSPPYGYRRIDNKYVLDEDEAAIIKMMFQMCINGSGLTTICKTLRDMGVKSRRGSGWIPKRVKYCLQNPVYCGKLRWNYSTHQGSRKVNDKEDWIIIDGTHPPIVSVEDFEKVNDILDRNTNPASKRPYNREIKHYLAGILRCNVCKGTLVYCTRNRATKTGVSYQIYYRCNNFQKGACKTSNYIRLEKMEAAFKERLRKDLKSISDNKGAIINILKHAEPGEIDILNKQLEKVRKKYSIAKRAYLAEIDSLEEYKMNKQEIAIEEQNIMNKIAALHPTEDKKTETLKFHIETALDIIDNPNISMKEKNEYLKSFIQCIEIDVKQDNMDVFYYE